MTRILVTGTTVFALILRSEEHTSELQSPCNRVCRLLLEKKKGTRDRCGAQLAGQSRHQTRGFACAGRWPLVVALISAAIFFLNEPAPPEIHPLPPPAPLPI